MFIHFSYINIVVRSYLVGKIMGSEQILPKGRVKLHVVTRIWIDLIWVMGCLYGREFQAYLDLVWPSKFGYRVLIIYFVYEQRQRPDLDPDFIFQSPRNRDYESRIVRGEYTCATKGSTPEGEFIQESSVLPETLEEGSVLYHSRQATIRSHLNPILEGRPHT